MIEGNLWGYFYGDFAKSKGEWTVTVTELVLPSTDVEWTDIIIDGQVKGRLGK
jgi:hypothetical protein